MITLGMSMIPKTISVVAFGVVLTSCAGSSRVGGILSPTENPQPQVVETPQTETKRPIQTKHAKKRQEPGTSIGTQVSEPANRQEVSSASAGEE
jgi:hypothetical protein